ncbi:hypothetical protein GCM10009740_06450 [Terrabacter terrae]|uniref:Fibronectin type-III domain-containing protein n=1 Tax=Terrabacter terrae TaxID=318434 RepID=A0ABN2TT82_9MICO
MVNTIACENTLPGTAPGKWQVNGAGDSTIQGFATSMSANAGETVTFKVSTPAAAYHIDILRMGYYQGNGARTVAANVLPFATLPQTQPACLKQAGTGLVDCGNWAASASWTVPSTAVSGVYLARLVRNDTNGASLVPFVVRNDTGHSDLLFQTSDQTWQAYNSYGGNSLYSCTVSCPTGNPDAYKGAAMVSYNRPWHSAADDNGHSWLMWAEYPMIRYLEANGYDVAYSSGVDTGTSAGGALLRNHKVFMSVGHDEYWSGTQRANVEAARDAGVHLAFFSGNEVFWKTRFQNSIDSTNTANRTLVCYKETHYNTSVDPQDPPTWTGTWQDPRFSPPADGGNPQNSLTGQQFIVNSGTTDIKVPAQYSKLRLWRNTAVSRLGSGQTQTLGAGNGTLGYEWDVDADNGFRPAGLFRLSSTTSSTAEIFTDYGGTTKANQTATHNLTLYRAPSGALVFGAGTVQWSFGLDSAGGTPDPVMQQATVNLFADMGAQPYALTSGLTVATASTDTAAPTSTITSPTSGSSVGDGGKVTISGTAADTGGGVVAGVEVSTDDGATWHPATGTTSWSYSWVAHGSPSTTIRTRAVDDSGNLGTSSAGVPVGVGCTCSIWGVAATPGTPDSGSATATEVGVQFRSESSGLVTGIRFYKATANTGTHTGSLWTASGTRLATATFTNETTSGWQQVTFATPVAINAGATYVASYFAPRGHTAADDSYFYPLPSPTPYVSGWVDSPPLHALRNVGGLTNGVFVNSTTSKFPSSSDSATNYWVDVMFTRSTAAATAPGAPTGVTAAPGDASARVSWSMPPDGGSAITSYTVTPYVGATAQTPITVTGTPPATNVTVTGLTNGTAYTFKASATNAVGTGPDSAASVAVTPKGYTCGPCTIWPASTVPQSPDEADTQATEVGTKFTSDVGGQVTGVRFYKASANTGTHIGSVWSASGTKLASATFTSETASGWQQVSFASPVTISPGTVYVVSYYAPNGHYSGDSAYFATSGVDNPPLHALKDGVSGGNGVYRYGTSSGFPNLTYDSENYYVDVVFATSAGPTAPAAPTNVSAAAGDKQATVTWTAPANGGSPITSYAVTPYIGSTAQPATTVTGTPPATTTTVTGLTNGTAYTFKVSATNAIGTSLDSTASNAVTPTASNACTSCTIWPVNANPANPSANDGSGVELGVKFTSDVSGQITAIRFYKGTGNTGTHTGTLWTSTGTKLASVTFTNESTTGWQQASFTTPVSITAGTVYVASYYAPAGHYAADNSAFASAGVDNAPLHALQDGVSGGNGTYAYSGASTFPTNTYQATNYWVDVVFSGTITAPGAPTGVSATPGDKQATVTWPAPSNGGSPITRYTVTPYIGTTAQTPTTVTGSPPATTVTVTGLTNGTGYSFKVSATNAVGTGSDSTSSNTVTPTAAVTCTGCTIWSSTAAPANPSTNDSSGVELGVKFTSDVSGQVTGIRFYKGTGNTGTHIGTLWTSTGTKLASATFTNETASGWQQVNFATPVSITAGTVYVASYYAPAGHYAGDNNTFAAAGVDNPPLHALQDGTSGGNGMFAYNNVSAFPNNSYLSSNYWVDVVFASG